MYLRRYGPGNLNGTNFLIHHNYKNKFSITDRNSQDVGISLCNEDTGILFKVSMLKHSGQNIDFQYRMWLQLNEITNMHYTFNVL